ncbi:MAG: hypothetical protein C3F13_13300 [Anaerolineales bacterium]|nr:MAG: hypothetical protein C3F13_13300 [Anaerolineales bacterium]
MRRNLIILLTLITAGIHVYFFTTGTGLLFTMFLLNALGYLGLLGLLYLPLNLPEPVHRLVRPVFIGYTILTIALYVIISASSGIWSYPLAPIAKLVELILVWQLWVEGRAGMPISTSRKSDAML